MNAKQIVAVTANVAVNAATALAGLAFRGFLLLLAFCATLRTVQPHVTETWTGLALGLGVPFVAMCLTHFAMEWVEARAKAVPAR